ncbi:ankyrin repeat domain-containing protein 6-like [Mytilus edulis]|uniref:ankyrin repeat domain-containing protein 6-like n=1 Tax=Mytilus edulis TaxID=6550 RepID=UPI0039F101D9
MSVVLFQLLGRTALMWAAIGGHLEICRLLIDTGCQIDITNVEGWTALMSAARWGRLEICRLLIDRGCKIDITDGSGRTALMLAALYGHLEICKLLIDTGCKIHITNGSGYTALIIAAVNGHLEVCRHLIDRGCKIDITSRDGYTALHWAAREGYLQITRCLVEQGGASPLVTTREGITPYDVAAATRRRQYKEVMEYLQTVMSEKSSGVSAKLKIEDEMVPTEIKLMADKRSIDLYLKLLESGSEKKRDIRLVVVGKKGAGKTSLIRRLFGEDIKDVTSTNGIEIHKIKSNV